MDINPITANIGVEIMGVNLEAVSAGECHQIRAALTDHKVVVFQQQDLDLDQLCSFSERFGQLLQIPFIEPLSDYPNVIAVLKEADEINMGVFGGDWHSDFSFLQQPPLASVLYSIQVPSVGGDTLWVNMAAAYENLPEDTKIFLEDKNVIHTGKPYGVKHAPPLETQFQGSIKMDRNNPLADNETVHPAVCRHPESGEAMLFVSPTYTTRFQGMSEVESEPMLAELYAHCTRPEFTCRVRWQPNMLVMWDNRSTMHYAVNDYDGHRRLLYRTTIAGHKPIPN